MTGRLPGPRRNLRAEVRVPPSKSFTNRALVMAAAAGGGAVENPLDCEDTRLLAEALGRCGWRLSWDRAVEVGARVPPAGAVRVSLGNSGTGSRLLMALLAAVPGRHVVDGGPRLRERPMGPLVAALRELGAGIEAAAGDRLPVTIHGVRIGGGELTMNPGASSQFVSALLLMAPLTERGLTLRLTGRVPSRPYLDLTRRVLEAFGADVTAREDGRVWRVSPGRIGPRTFRVEGDWSAAAFFAAAACVAGGEVHIGPLEPDSAQGDRRMVDILARAGAGVRFDGRRVIVRGPLARPIDADLGDTPDLFPALAAAAAAAPPGSRLAGLENLRYKESDRLGVMVDNLERLGAVIRTRPGEVVFERGTELHEGTVAVTAAGDHRIAMAMAVAALGAGPLELDDTGCVDKSFPGFWREWSRVTG